MSSCASGTQPSRPGHPATERTFNATTANAPLATADGPAFLFAPLEESPYQPAPQSSNSSQSASPFGLLDQTTAASDDVQQFGNTDSTNVPPPPPPGPTHGNDDHDEDCANQINSHGLIGNCGPANDGQASTDPLPDRSPLPQLYCCACACQSTNDPVAWSPSAISDFIGGYVNIAGTSQIAAYVSYTQAPPTPVEPSEFPVNTDGFWVDKCGDPIMLTDLWIVGDQNKPNFHSSIAVDVWVYGRKGYEHRGILDFDFSTGGNVVCADGVVVVRFQPSVGAATRTSPSGARAQIGGTPNDDMNLCVGMLTNLGLNGTPKLAGLKSMIQRGKPGGIMVKHGMYSGPFNNCNHFSQGMIERYIGHPLGCPLEVNGFTAEDLINKWEMNGPQNHRTQLCPKFDDSQEAVDNEDQQE